MKIHLYSQGKDLANQKITFEEAMFFLENQDTIEQDQDNFIGFTASDHQDAVLQFVREEEDKWVIDIPVVKNDEYLGSYVSVGNHSIIISMVTNFFIKDANLRKAIVRQDYDLLEEECASRWSIAFHFVEG